MASEDGGKWKGVRNLIHKFDFGKEMQTSLQTELFALDASSRETSATLKPNMDPTILKRHSSEERDVQRRSTKGSGKRKCVMFQEFSEHSKKEDLQNDLGSPKQMPIQRKMLSVRSVDQSVSNKQETTENRFRPIILSRNAIEQDSRAANIKLVESTDRKKEVGSRGPCEQQEEEFEFETIQDELKKVTCLVLQMESALREAKETLTKLSQKLDERKTEQQRKRDVQLQNKKEEPVMEMLSKETQTLNADNMLEEVSLCDAPKDENTTQPKQDEIDNAQTCQSNGSLDEIGLGLHVRVGLHDGFDNVKKCRPDRVLHEIHADKHDEFDNTQKGRPDEIGLPAGEQNYFDNVQTCRPDKVLDEIDSEEQDEFDNTQKGRPTGVLYENDSEELNVKKCETEFPVETKRVADTGKKDPDVICSATLDDRILREHADEQAIIISNEAEEETKHVIEKNERKSFENDGTKSDKTMNARLGKDRQANESNCYEVVVDETQLKDTHLETKMTGTDKQIDEHDVSGTVKLTQKETTEEGSQNLTEVRKKQQKEDTEIAIQTDDQHTNENKVEENTTKTKSHERNLDSNLHKNEDCLHTSALSVNETEEVGDEELAEMSDTVDYHFGTTNQGNQCLNFSDAIRREFNLKNKRQSEYGVKGWVVDIRKDLYCAENRLHEIDFSELAEQMTNSEKMNQDVKKNLDEASSKQRLNEETNVKTKTEIKSPESSSEKEDKILSVKPCDDAAKAIWGVAKFNDDLFLLRDSSLSSEVWQVKEESFQYLWKFRGKPLDMTGDSRNRRLYISRCVEPDNEIMISVHDINKAGRPCEIPKHSWRVHVGRYATLSVTTESNILLTLMESRKLVEYTYNGAVENVHREIAIDDIANPLHAVKQSSDSYVVCHGENRDEKHRVCIVNVRGQLLKEFCLRTYSDVNMSVVPMYLALGREGSIIVAENRNGRVVQLNADLTVANVLLTINDGLRGPCRLHLDETSGQITVADNEHGWRDGKLLIRDIHSLCGYESHVPRQQ